MIATAFLGYEHSPKWFNMSIFIFSLLGLVYYTILKKSNILIYFAFSPGPHIGDHRRYVNTMKNINYNKYFGLTSCNKVKYILNSHRGYSTISSFASQEYKNIESSSSERLLTIIKELGLNPVYIFENLESENIKTQIRNDTKGLSGIYMIINKITKAYYIGSTSTNRFYSRISNHLIYFRGSKIVKSAVKKYDLKNFAFIILELYPNVVTKENNKELLDLEDKYLKLLLPNYNILTEAGTSFGYKHTEVDRKKMKDFYSDARREMIGSLNRGKKLSPETIEKIREKALKRPPMTDETTKKCISNTRPVVLFNLNGTVYGEYPSILEAAKSINCGEKTIRRALKTEKRLVKRQ